MNDKAAILEAPQVLCNLLTPYSFDESLKSSLLRLEQDELLLEKVVECANQHMVISTLFSQLRCRQFHLSLPAQLQAYMEAMYEQQRTRNSRLKEQAKSIVFALNAVDIEPLLMKGGDTLFYDLYPSTGARFMSDLDVLLPDGSMNLAWDTLLDQGYCVPDKYKDIKQGLDPHHAKPIYRAGDDCAVELHYKPLNHKSGRFLSTSEAFESAQLVSDMSADEMHACSLSPHHKLMHCFVHSEISHGSFRRDQLDIRQMDYFVRLAHYYKNVIDWQLIRSELDKSGFEEDFAIYYHKASELFSLPKISIASKSSAKKLKYYHQSSLKSSMIQHYPWLRFKYGCMHLVRSYSKVQLSGRFDVGTTRSYVKAIVLQSHFNLKRFYNSPRSFLWRLSSIIFGK